jgi:Protein of unknown function (DUF559)
MLLSPLQRLPDSPFTATQAEALGVSRSQLKALVASRQVKRVFHGVYWPSTLADTLENRAAAVWLIKRPFWVLCDQLAAWIHGVDTFEYRELEIFPPLDVLVLRGNNRVRRQGCRGTERDLSSVDITEARGLTLTTELRTALDLGCRLSRRSALAALDAFMRNRDFDRADLEAELPRYAGRRGVVQLRELVTLADARAESPGESWTRLAILDANIPAPIPQYSVEHGGRELYRLDLAWPHHKVAVEYDGREFHDSDAQREYDRRRRSWLRQHGWTVIVVTKDSFKDEALRAWLEELRAALRLG